jgi:hypothetical protein
MVPGERMRYRGEMIEQAKTILAMQIQDALDDYTKHTGKHVKAISLDHFETTIPGDRSRNWMYIVEIKTGRLTK